MFQVLTTPQEPNMRESRRFLIRVVLLSMLVKILLAMTVPMGVDEAYATAVAREFSWSFFDHPPIGFWSPVVAANLIGVEHPLVYRLPVLFYGIISTFLMYALGKELGGERAGLWTLVLYVLSPAFLIAGGVFVLPDGPLELGSLIAMLFLIKIVKSDGPAPLRFWIFAGLGLAFALASKYQAALIPIAALVFAVATPVGRKWFRQTGPYIASAIGVLGLLPTLVWNMQHDWASFTFHSGRTGDGLQLGNFVLMVIGQGLYLLPPVLVLAAIGLWRGFDRDRPALTFLALAAAAPVLVFNFIYLFSSKSFPHWTFPGWQFALPLAGVWLAAQSPAIWARSLRWLKWAAGLTWAVLVIAVLHANTGVLTRLYSAVPPKWDRTETAFDYSGLRKALQQKGLLQDLDLIIVPGWINAGLLSTGLGGDFPVRVLGDNPHHFAFMSGEHKSGNALMMTIKVLKGQDKIQSGLLATAKAIDPKAQNLPPIILDRGGQPYLAVTLIRLTVPEGE